MALGEGFPVVQTAVGERRLAFGRNWQDPAGKLVSQVQVETSASRLLGFLGLDDLRGKTFLDIGCGRGLRSLAAWQRGAARVVSFDDDRKAVRRSALLKRHAGYPPNWQLFEGSVLDADFMARIEPADIVHSWDVLNRTGNVWRAIENAATRVKVGGQFYIALCSADRHVDPTPDFWLDLKLHYNASTIVGRRMIELWYIWRFDLERRLSNLPTLLRRIRASNAKHGASFYADLKDWVGGWPMQFCRDADVTRRVESMGFRQTRMAPIGARTEFLFVREP